MSVEALEARLVLSLGGELAELQPPAGPRAAASAHDVVPGELLIGFQGDVRSLYRAGNAEAALQKASELVRGLGLSKPRFLENVLGGDRARNDALPMRWQLPGGADLESVAGRLARRPDIAYAEPNYLVSADVLPSDPRFDELWGLNNTGQMGGTPDADIDAPEAWDITRGSRSVVVGVIDTGLDYTHPDVFRNVWVNQGEIPLAVASQLTDVDGDGLFTLYDLNDPANWTPGDGSSPVSDLNGSGFIDAGDLLTDPDWADGLDTDGNGFTDDLVGWDFANNDNDPFDDNEHGTHVSGTIGGMADNGVGIAGVSHAVQVMALKFLDFFGSGTTADAVEAINYATAMGADLTNNSWGGGGFSTALRNAIAASGQADMLFVAAAGNDGQNSDLFAHYPSSYNLDNIISVAATDRSDALAYFSNFGQATVDLGAPGDAILSTVPGGGYAVFSGTSMATPHVSGVAALALGLDPTATAADVRDAIFAGADPVASLDGLTVTGGRLNALNTLEKLNPDRGIVSLDKEAYGGGDAALSVTVLDGSANLGASLQVELTVADSGGAVRDTETLLLTQAALRTYTGSIAFDAAGGAGTLQVADGDNVTVSYADADSDGQGTPATVTDSASIDLQPPLISAVSAAPGARRATIGWITNEPGDSVVRYGDDPANLNLTTNAASLATSHSLTLTGLAPETTYFYQVESSDAAGNTTIDAGHTFTTLEIPPILLVDDDEGDALEDYFTGALDAGAFAYDVWDVSARSASPSAGDLAPYNVVIWNTGAVYLSPTAGLTGAEQSAIAAFLDGGGNLFLSGQDVLYDGVSLDFSTNYLHLAEYLDDEGPTRLTGAAGDPIGNGMDLPLSLPLAYEANYADTLLPDSEAEGVLLAGPGTFTFPYSAVRHAASASSPFNLVFFAFPFEAISTSDADPNNQAAVMKRVVDWLQGTEAPLTVSVGDVTVSEGDAGTVEAVFTVSLSSSSDQPVSVDYATSDESATGGSDYATTSGTLTFAANETEQTIPVQVYGDTLNEDDETFLLTLSNPTNVQLGDGQAVATIRDDDFPPILLVDDDQGDSLETYFTSALDGGAFAYDVWDVSARGAAPSASELAPYSAVVWNTGADYSSPTAGLTGAEQSAIAAFLDGGGNLFLSGQDVLFNGVSLGFRTNYLHLADYLDDEAPTRLTGAAGDPIGNGMDLPLSLPPAYEANYADTLLPDSEAEGVLLAGPGTFTFPYSAVRHAASTSSPFNLVFFAFPFEAISTSDADPNNQAAVMKRVVSWLGVEVPGISVSPTTGLHTTEKGGTASFNVVLDAAPDSDVVIPIHSSNTSEGAVSVDSLRFTAENWDTPQTVTVTGRDDDVPDGPVAYTVVTGPAVSDDSDYSGRDAADVSLINLDDDIPGPFLRTGEVVATTSGWTSVTLDHNYASMVVVATPDYDESSVPVVSRIRNATGNSFEIRLDRADNLSGEVSAAVQYMVVEEGIYNAEIHGVTMEAAKFTSTVTDRAGSWVGESRAYANSYVDPVVVGQVMSYNDPNWSVFWSRGDSRTDPASAGQLWVGKHVGEDANTVRAAETVGYVVIETGGGVIGSTPYVAAVGGDSVQGITQSAPFTYSFSGLSAPTGAVLSQAGMDGGNGGWAVLYGDDPLDAGSLRLAIDEDRMSDNERNHTDEQVSYLVFQAPAVQLVESGGATTATEGGATDSYKIALTTQPTADVSITASPDAQTDLGAGPGAPITLVFTPADWSTPQSVAVAAVDDNVIEGDHTSTIQHTASSADADYDGISIADVQVDITDNDFPAVSLRTGVANVSSGSWTTVTLDHSYNSMVVVATPQYDEFAVPVVSRIRNAAGDSFDVRIERADGLGGVVAGAVQYMVVEEGVYTLAENGVTMEAVKFASTVTDRAGSWVGENRAYANNYVNPVVVGQVMSYNDPGWSVFWSRGGSRTAPATGSQLWVGKHVGEDGDTTRAPETIGYVVFEGGSGTIGSTAYTAAVGADTIRGMGNSPPYAYAIDGVSAPTSAVASQTGMDGGNGGWAVLYGTDPLGTGTLQLAIDEDQVQDGERNHTNEQVAYLVFADLTATNETSGPVTAVVGSGAESPDPVDPADPVDPLAIGTAGGRRLAARPPSGPSVSPSVMANPPSPTDTSSTSAAEDSTVPNALLSENASGLLGRRGIRQVSSLAADEVLRRLGADDFPPHGKADLRFDELIDPIVADLLGSR